MHCAARVLAPGLTPMRPADPAHQGLSKHTTRDRENGSANTVPCCAKSGYTVWVIFRAEVLEMPRRMPPLPEKRVRGEVPSLIRHEQAMSRHACILAVNVTDVGDVGKL